MSQFRRDPVTGRWVINYTDKELGPQQYSLERPEPKGFENCPFCEGNEKLTPPEIFAMRCNEQKDTMGWKVRCVPNKFPALYSSETVLREGVGVYDKMSGIGNHEVIIETPKHFCAIPEMDLEQLYLVLKTCRQRFFTAKEDSRYKYVMLFKNYGVRAGASLEHPHWQLIALPIVPKRVNEELKGAKSYFEYKDRCVFCDMVRQETMDVKRVVFENDKFLAFCPFASCFPFEVWILPKRHMAKFEMINDEQIQDLAHILKNVLTKVRVVLNDVCYNFIVHTAPLFYEGLEYYHWHIEVMPKLTRVAGFEWGSGFYINKTAPETAATYLVAV